MRRMLVIAVAACGRIGFDPTAASDAASDAPPVPITNMVTFTTGTGPDWVRGLARSADGYLVVGDAGGGLAVNGLPLPFRGGTQDAFLLSLDPTGALRWSASCGSSGDDLAVAVTTDPAGNIYIGGGVVVDNGNVPGTGNLDCGGGPLPSNGYMPWLASFTSAGALRWAHSYPSDTGPIGQEIDSVRGLGFYGGRLLAGGFVHGGVDFGAGVVPGSGTSFEPFVLELDADGNYQSVRRFGGAPTVTRGFVVAADGSHYLDGQLVGTIDFGTGPITSAGSSSVFIAAFDATGAPRWAHAIGDSGTTDGRALAVGSNGHAYVAGTFDGQLTNQQTITPTGGVDMFVAELAADGTPLGAAAFGGAGCEYTRGITTGGSDVILTGRFTGTVTFAGTMVSSTAGADGVVARFHDGLVPASIRAVAGPLDEEVAPVLAVPNGVLAGVWRDEPVSGPCAQQDIHLPRTTTLEVIAL